MAMMRDDPLSRCLTVLPTDYRDYGGSVERWADAEQEYPDCSCGCRYFVLLGDEHGADWGICAKPDGPRAGLLTFEHQAGFGCFALDTDRIAKQQAEYEAKLATDPDHPGHRLRALRKQHEQEQQDQQDQHEPSA